MVNIGRDQHLKYIDIRYRHFCQTLLSLQPKMFFFKVSTHTNLIYYHKSREYIFFSKKKYIYWVCLQRIYSEKTNLGEMNLKKICN